MDTSELAVRKTGKKRSIEACDGRLTPPPDLPDVQAEVVTAALDRWGTFRAVAEALRPTLDREDELMQEILDRGLRGEDRRTLRRLASGGGGRDDEEEVVRQVSAAIGEHKDALAKILFRNHHELMELSATTVPDKKRDLIDGLDRVRDDLRIAQDAVHGELLAAKSRVDMTAVRSSGRSFNDLKALLRRLESERREVTKNSTLASLLVTVCRRVLPVRQIDPHALGHISPSHEGYLRIMDFYFFSDASFYCFGEHFSGPNWFTRLKRNVAILNIYDHNDQVVYNKFAVSGEHKTPGEKAAPLDGPLQAIEAEDENGRLFDRRHDAEFKLLIGFCATIHAASLTSESLSQTSSASTPANNIVATSSLNAAPTERDCAPFVESTSPAPWANWEGRGKLWSKKPLCRSCAGAVRQLEQLFPLLRLEMAVGDMDEDGRPASVVLRRPASSCDVLHR